MEQFLTAAANLTAALFIAIKTLNICIDESEPRCAVMIGDAGRIDAPVKEGRTQIDNFTPDR